MPVYEYVCRACKHGFEELVPSMERPADVRCPTCGESDVVRKPSVFRARQGTSAGTRAAGERACLRCGDPDGPCAG